MQGLYDTAECAGRSDGSQGVLCERPCVVVRNRRLGRISVVVGDEGVVVLQVVHAIGR